MALPRTRIGSLVAVFVLLTAVAPSAEAQTLTGRVLDASNEQPVSVAGIYLLDRDREGVAMAMADSTGRWVLVAPSGGEYFLVVQRFGYVDVESPLFAIEDGKDYALDFEMRPEPLGLAPVTVTVRNEELIDWLRLEMGVNPVSLFGFRILQGSRLEEARLKGRNKPTETLRWLYIPVSHGLECVMVNTYSRPRSVSSFRGARVSQLPAAGQVPSGTSSFEERLRNPSRGCGSLYLNDRPIPNEQLEHIDMSRVAVIVTLPGLVKMYTYDFDWAFRDE